MRFRIVIAAALLACALCPRAARAQSLLVAPNNSGVLPLVIDARSIPGLDGASLIGLSMFRCDAGRTIPIVFQVDEVNEQGMVVSSDSLPEVKPDEAPGVLDPNDQIVMLQRDIGVRCAAEQLDRARGKLVEIEASSAALKETAYVYLLSSERGHVPTSNAIRYDRTEHAIKTPAYEMSYAPALPHMIRTFILRELRGRSDQNIIDRLKVRMVAKALGSLVQLHMTEEDVKGRQLSARVGPVRVVRELELDVRPVPGLAIPAHVRFENYERLFRGVVRFKIPRSAALVVSSMDLFLVVDYLDARGIRVSAAGLPQGALVDGVTAASEKEFDLGARRWFLLTGEGINHVSVLHMEEGLNLRPTARFSDGEGPEYAWPPERVPGGLPQVGYGLLGWQDLEARWYQFAVDIGMLPSFPERGGDGFSDADTAKFTIRANLREGDGVSSAK